MALPAPSREELEDLSACMSGVSISRHQPKRLQSTSTPASVARPRAVRKLHDGSEEGSDIDEDLQDKENTRGTPVQNKQAEAKDMHLPQGVTPSRLACLGDLKDELTCCICLDICVRPVTTPCGHNFCRACLTTAQLHSNTCAKCREVLPRDFNLKVNTALWNTIRLLFPAVGLAPLTPVAPAQASAQRRAISSTITVAQAFRRPRSTMPSQQLPSQQHAFTRAAAVPALHDPHSQLDMLLELLDTEPSVSQPLSGHAYRSSHSSTTTHAVWPTLRPLTSSGRAQSAALQSNRPATVSTSLMYGQLQPLSVGAAMTTTNNSNNTNSTHPRYISTSHEFGGGAAANPAQPVSLFRRIPAHRSASDSGTAAAVAAPAPPLLVQRGSVSQNGSSRGNGRAGLLRLLTNDPTNPPTLEQWQHSSQAVGPVLEDNRDDVQGMQHAQASGYSVSSARNLQALLPQNPFMRSTQPYPTLHDTGMVGTQQRAVTAVCPPACPQHEHRPFARLSMSQRQPTVATAPHSARERLPPHVMPRVGAARTSELSSQAVTHLGSMASPLQQQQWGNESDSTHGSDQDLEDTSDDDDVILLPTPQPSRPAAAVVPPASHAPAVSQSATSAGPLLLPPACRQSHLRDTVPRWSTADQSGSVSLRTSPVGLPAVGHPIVLVAHTDCPQDGVAEDTLTPVRAQSKAARPFVRSPDLLCPPVQNVQQATAQHSWQQRHDTGTAGWDTASMLYSEQAAHSTLTLTAFAPAPAVPSGHSTHTVTYCSEDDEEMITLDSLDLLSSPDIGSEPRESESQVCLSEDEDDIAPPAQQRALELPFPQLSLPAIGSQAPASLHEAEQHSVQSVRPFQLAEPEAAQEDRTFVLFRGGNTAARRSDRIAHSRGSQVHTDVVGAHDIDAQRISASGVTDYAPGSAQVVSSVYEPVTTSSSTSDHASEPGPPPLRQSARLVPGLRRPSTHASSRH